MAWKELVERKSSGLEGVNMRRGEHRHDHNGQERITQQCLLQHCGIDRACDFYAYK
jgi:hypothetical protein